MNLIATWLNGEAKDRGKPIPFPNNEGGVYTLEEIVEEYDLKKHDRSVSISDLRHYFMWYCYNKLQMTGESIGAMLNRNHSTTVHASQKVYGLLEVGDEEFMKRTSEIKRKLETIKPKFNGKGKSIYAK